MIGVEFIDELGKPNGAACNKIMQHCLSEGLILINCGPERNTIRFIPPLITTDEEMTRAVATFEQALRSLR
jgi:4-aminobutyrate aminotransferase